MASASDLHGAGERCASGLYRAGERCASNLYREGGGEKRPIRTGRGEGGGSSLLVASPRHVCAAEQRRGRRRAGLAQLEVEGHDLRGVASHN